MNFTEYIRHIVQLRGYSFAYGDAREINRVLTTMDFSQSKNGIVAFAHLVTEEENDDHARATLAVFFCHLCPFDFDANDTGEWQGYLRNAANTMFSDISAGNIARTSNMRYSYGYDDYAENVLWVCARFTIEALQCGCNEFIFRDEIVKNIEYVRTLENGDYEYKITFTDGSTQMFASPRGPQGGEGEPGPPGPPGGEGEPGPPGPPGTTDYNELQNKPTKLSDFENDAQYIKLQEVKPNGNIVLTDGTNSKEYMAATPSGDPMHYAYVAAGAEYNATGADIVKTDEYGEQITHKAGYWYLNGLGDLTNEEVAISYNEKIGASPSELSNYLIAHKTIRTNFITSVSRQRGQGGANVFNLCRNCTKIETFNIGNYAYISGSTTYGYFFQGCNKLKKVYGTLDYTTAFTIGNGCPNLTEIRIFAAMSSLNLSGAKSLSISSILYLINNTESSRTNTYTLHADAYARAMADTDIQAALAANPNVSLASA